MGVRPELGNPTPRASVNKQLWDRLSRDPPTVGGWPKRQSVETAGKDRLYCFTGNSGTSSC